MPWEQTDKFIRSGHRGVDEFKPETFRTIWISQDEGIKAIVGRLKHGDTVKVVSYLFMLDKGWTLEKAKEWFRKHHRENNRVTCERICCLTPILEKLMENPLRIRGVALTAGMSRNFNIYLNEELEKLAEKLKGAPVYLEHVSALNSVGKVTNAVWDSKSRALMYEAEIYDEDTQDKIRKGLIQHVSVAADYERIDMINGKVPYGLHNAELSLVAVPGVPQTNIEIMEKLDNYLSNLDLLDKINRVLENLARCVLALEEDRKNREFRRNDEANRAVIAPEALETQQEAQLDLSKVRLRDVMKKICG